MYHQQRCVEQYETSFQNRRKVYIMDEHLHRCVDMLNTNEVSVRNSAAYLLLKFCEKILHSFQ